MAERKYSVAEIDRMRRALEWAYPTGVSYYAEQRGAEIENRLRTYMQNGTEPSELEEVAQERMRAETQMRQRQRL